MRFLTPFVCVFLLLAAFTQAQQLQRRSFLGARLSTPDTVLADGVSHGAQVDGIIPRTTAATAGLRPGDFILRLNGELIADAHLLARAIGDTRAGVTLALDVLRDGMPLRIAAAVQSFPVEAHWNSVAEYRTVGYRGERFRAVCTRPVGDGPFPTVFIVQGGDCNSVEEPFGGVYYSLVDSLSEHGFATVRVDKNGVGDSEGPACGSNPEFTTGVFSETLAWLRNLTWVRRDQIFIYGHGEGGTIAPVIASRYPLAGVIVWGSFCRPWPQVALARKERLMAMEGSSASDIAAVTKAQAKAYDLFFDKKLSPDSIKAGHPGLLNDRVTLPRDSTSLAFAKLNLAADWERVRSRVLVLQGEHDLRSFKTDQEMIVNIVNGSRPHTASFRVIKGIDHAYRRVASMKESLTTTDEAIDISHIGLVAAWMKGVVEGEQ